MFERTPLSNIPHTLLQLKWIWLTNALLRGTCPQNTNDICPLSKAIEQLCGTHIKLASACPFPWAKRCRKKRREIYESWFQTNWWETFLRNSWHWKKRSEDLRYGAQFNAPQKEKHVILFNVDHNLISMWRSTGRFSLQDFHNSLKNKSCSWCFQESQMHTKKDMNSSLEV